MIDFVEEPPIPLDEIPPELIPGRRGPVHIVTLQLWCTRGVRRVKLESLLIGGRRCTSLQALRRFYERVSEARDLHHAAPAAASTVPAPAPPRTQRQRGKDVQQAVKTLRKAGA